MIVLPQNGKFTQKWKCGSAETYVKMKVLNTLTSHECSTSAFTVETSVVLRPLQLCAAIHSLCLLIVIYKYLSYTEHRFVEK
jgi:hypothetical protein